MATEEEQNRPTAPAGIPLQGETLEAALAAAGRSGARYTQNIDYILPEGDAPGNFSEAAAQIELADFDWAKQNPANINAPPELTLVSNREEELITPAAAQEAALGLLVKMNLTRSDPGVGDVIASIENAKTRSELNLAIANAQSELQMVANEKSQAASSGGDLERQQLWGEIGRLNNEVRDILHPHMTEEERKQDAEFRERIRNARTEEERLAIQREYTRWRQPIIDRLEQSDDPEKRRAARQAQPIQDQINEREDEMERRLQRITERENARAGNTNSNPAARGERTPERGRIIASGEANIDSLGDLPSGINTTTARRPNGDPLERI